MFPSTCGFLGEHYDAETGLHYNYFRDYDPATGRYIQSDPIGLEGGVNTYAYVGGNPLSYVDLFGLSKLIFNPSVGSLSVVTGGGETVGQYPASNNAQRSSRGPLASGSYGYRYHVPHRGETSNGKYGSNGNFVFNVPGCSGCGVHSGRANSCDLAGRCGSNFATSGCIRTTDDATRLIKELADQGDPLTDLIVLQPGPKNQQDGR